MKGGKLIAEGGYGCVFNPGINCNGSVMKEKKYASKIQRYDEAAKNEINIGKIIEGINGYEDHFGAIIRHCEIDIATIKDKEKNKCAIFKKKKSKKFIVMKMNFIDGNDFMDYLISQKNSIQLISNIINSYNHIIRSCQMLVTKSIMHFDIKGTNILFDNNKQIPILIDFGLSTNMLEINDNLKKVFYVYAPQYYIWPLEVHYLSFLFNKSNVATIDDLKEMVKIYVKENKGLSIFSPDFLQKFEKKCLSQLLKYNEIPLKKRIDKLVNYWKTFDNYSVSIMYLKFLKYINIDGFSDNNFIIFFGKLLLQNIHPDPEKRLSLIDTVHTFNTFLYQKHINNIQTFEELTDNIIKNKFLGSFDKEVTLARKNDYYQTKTMKILKRKSLK